MIQTSRLSAALLIFFVSLSFMFLCPGWAHASAGVEPFPMLPGLEEYVEFWKPVFTRYTSLEWIFHDPLEANRIYRVVRVEENSKTITRQIVQEQRKEILKEHGLKGDEKRVHVQRGIRERFAAGVQRSERFLGKIQDIFREEGLPIELAYLPLIESSFVTHARSRAGAVGIWQFMRSTGRRYLRIDSIVDERRDPLESTRAAARLLKENYEIFGNWPLAITAYNHGREGMLRASKEIGSKDLMEIIRRYKGPVFGFASKNFYAEFLAALAVVSRKEEFFPDMEYDSPLPLEELKLERAIPVTAFLKRTDVSRSEFLEWNPALSKKITTLPKGYRVKVTPERLESFVVAYRGIVEPPRVRQKKQGVPAGTPIRWPSAVWEPAGSVRCGPILDRVSLWA